MATEESPAVARRRLRLALRRMREAGGYTQQQIADSLSWSLSKVQRIESGDVGISPSDTRSLASYLGLSDSPTVTKLVEDAKVARKRGWWSEARYREYLSPATIKLLQFEGEAKFIRVYQPAMFPGILQTPAMAEAVLRGTRLNHPAEVTGTRLEARLRRREHVFDQTTPPAYLLILDQAVILRHTGGIRTLLEQLVTIRSDITESRLILRILPFTASDAVASAGPFTLLQMEDEEVLYREDSKEDYLIFDSSTIESFRGEFERMWAACLTTAASKNMLDAQIAALKEFLDQQGGLTH